MCLSCHEHLDRTPIDRWDPEEWEDGILEVCDRVGPVGKLVVLKMLKVMAHGIAHDVTVKPRESKSELLAFSWRKAKEIARARFDEEYTGGRLAEVDGNLSEAARRAGIDRSNFKRIRHRALVHLRKVCAELWTSL